MSIDSEPGGVRIRKTHTVGGGWCLWKIEMLCNGRWHPLCYCYHTLKEKLERLLESDGKDIHISYGPPTGGTQEKPNA